VLIAAAGYFTTTARARATASAVAEEPAAVPADRAGPAAPAGR
jgi:hypothetical protein